MVRLSTGLLASIAIGAIAFVSLALPTLFAPADKNGAPESSEPKGAGKETVEPDERAKDCDADTSKDEGKPEQAPPAGATGEIKSGVKMKDLLAKAFLIRSTVLVPADAVTRRIGKVSSHAIILTLQKETAIAVAITRSRLM